MFTERHCDATYREHSGWRDYLPWRSDVWHELEALHGCSSQGEGKLLLRQGGLP